MDAATHTPLPWKQNTFMVVGQPFGGMHGGREVCHTGICGNKSAESELNAEFIVLACNSHEQLLSACAAAADLIEGDSGNGGQLNESARRIVRQLREAISAAEGNTP